MENCKYYTRRIKTIRDLISCLYGLDDGNCCTGGLLHIVTDDGNLEDSHIRWCMERCEVESEREEAGLGKLICSELLKLSMEQRRLVYEPDWLVELFCGEEKRCDDCPIQHGLEGERE